jgi:uncharacterized membrane protein (UPF0182 family)
MIISKFRTSALARLAIQLAQLRVSHLIAASMAMVKVWHWLRRYEVVHMLPNEPQAT